MKTMIRIFSNLPSLRNGTRVQDNPLGFIPMICPSLRSGTRYRGFLPLILSLITGMLATAFSQLNVQTGLYLGETPPDTIPVKFAPDFFRVPDGSVYSITFSPALDEIYFSRYSASSGNNIWYSKMTDSIWSRPAKARFTQSYWTIEPNFSPDGNKLFFVSDMTDPPGGPPTNILQIWNVERKASGWSSPVKLKGSFSDSIKMFPSVAANGNLYYTDISGRGHPVIFRSEYRDSSYQTPVILDSNINRFFTQAHSYITPDEQHLIFDACPDGPPDWRSYLYISHRDQDGSWGRAQRLSPAINSSSSQYCPSISPDGKYLFFARNNDEGSTDLWWVKADNIFHPTGIGDNNTGESGEIFRLYPNPAKDRLTLALNVNIADLNPLICIYDLQGRMVIMEKISKLSTIIDISQLDKGCYFLKLKYSKNQQVTTFIKD